MASAVGADDPEVDVTVVMTAHREGVLLRTSLNSVIRSIRHAEVEGCRVEVLLVLDDVDMETLRVAIEAERDLGITLLRVGNRDLGRSRNDGVLAARGRWIAITDGDDLYGEAWIRQCWEHSREASKSEILHPELVVLFGAEQGHYWQRGSNSAEFSAACALVMNPFNSCVFTAKNVLVDTPYVEVGGPNSGFGYEDWHWNCETLAKGIEHVAIPRSVMFVRRKALGSLSRSQAGFSAIPLPSHLFDQL